MESSAAKGGHLPVCPCALVENALNTLASNPAIVMAAIGMIVGIFAAQLFQKWKELAQKKFFWPEEISYPQRGVWPRSLFEKSQPESYVLPGIFAERGKNRASLSIGKLPSTSVEVTTTSVHFHSPISLNSVRRRSLIPTSPLSPISQSTDLACADRREGRESAVSEDKGKIADK